MLSTTTHKPMIVELTPLIILSIVSNNASTYENSYYFVSSVFSGHHTILVPPGDLEANPALWLTVVSQYKGIS